MDVLFRCTQIKMYSWDNAQVVLVGNKCDLEQDRAVTQERGKRLADQLGNCIRCCLLNVRFRYVFHFFRVYSFPLDIYLYVVLYVLYFSRVLQIKTHSWEKTPVILVGNKCDMANEKVVMTIEGKKLADGLCKVFFSPMIYRLDIYEFAGNIRRFTFVFIFQAWNFLKPQRKKISMSKLFSKGKSSRSIDHTLLIRITSF